MSNSGFCAFGNSWWWIIILVIVLVLLGNGGTYDEGDCGCGCNR